MPYPAGNIAVVDARLQDISGGMQWNMQDADDIRFLAVSGTVTVGASRARYDFTLVKYYLHIDEVPWLIFSTLNNALEQEFDAEFWDIVNKNRKERWGFLEVPWIAGKEVYDVDAPYPEVRMSIFDDRARTIRVVRPFVWKDTYLKVHPNGAAIFAEDKKLAFFLPLIIEAHRLLPTTPLFWTNDDKTIPLYRTTLWRHACTIQWLAETGEAYPPELRDVIQPRLDKLRPPQPARPKQPPQPPRPTRWQERAERPQEKTETQVSQGSTSQDPQASNPSPQQLAEHEKQYMELQAIVASLGQRTLAESRPTATQPGQAPDTTKVQPAPHQVDAGTRLQSGITDHGTTKDPTSHNSSQPLTTKVSAQSLAEARPEPPPPPATEEPKEDAPGTGELSAHAPDRLGTNKPTQPKQRQQPLIVEVHRGASPILSPTESPDTLASETVVVSSPATDQEEDINSMDYATLQSRQIVALETVQELTARLAKAQDIFGRITKRLKTMQECQEPPTPPAYPVEDIEMEGMD